MDLTPFYSSLREFFKHGGRNKSYWIGYSGGLDSHVLLFLCCKLRAELNLDIKAIHINHQLSPNAALWAKHCQQVCEALAVPFVVRSIELNLSSGNSLEEIAREKRYAVMSEYLTESSVLLTAHQRDDQAETLLIQLLRGAGLMGLSAMPTMKRLGAGYHARPLLQISRASLAEVAEAQRLHFVEDESNHHRALTRNFIRHEVMPILAARWPTVSTMLARSAKHCAEAQVLLEDLSITLLKDCAGSRKNTLSVQRLLVLDEARVRLIIRAFVKAQAFPLPDSAMLNTIVSDVLNADWDRMPMVSWGGVELRRHRDDLYLIRQLPVHDPRQMYSWNVTQPLYFSGIGRLAAVPAQGRGLKLTDELLTVSFRKGGEVLDLPKRGRHTLKNLFQEWDVLPWLRDRIPLIYAGDRLVSVLGYFTAPDVCAKADEVGYELIWDQQT